jgi:hypothetical protein
MGNGMRLLAAFSLVLVPGLFAWWTGRALVRRRDDPLLSEQLMALDLARGHGVRATLPEDAGWPEEAVLLGDRPAVLTTGQDTSRVALYQLTDPAPAATRR